ncbi:MAG TPA: sulfatase-like hydrolase/transferase, partial [Acidimicrobiia bacterium]
MSRVRRFDHCAALAVLTALGISWPVLELLGNNAEFFLARSATKGETILAAIALGLLAPLLVGLVGLLPGKVGRAVGLGLMVVPATALAFLFVRRLPFAEPIAQGLALALGIATPVAFVRLEGARLLFRYLSPVPLLMPLIFTFATPAGATVLDRPITASLASPDNPVTVVMIVLDEFPLASLIDPEGNLRADRYPNFARLARDGTWFRNAMTVQQQTEHSVPAMLTGVNPDQDLEPFAGQYPNNLFTVLSESHRLVVDETITRLCPMTICARPVSAGSFAERSRSMIQDIQVIAGHTLLPGWATASLPQIDRTWGDFGAASAEFSAIDAFNEEAAIDPRAKLEHLAAALAASDGSDPTLFFTHAVIPHYPWVFLPSGDRYLLNEQRVPGTKGTGWTDDSWLIAQGLQRHLLQVQYADAAIGEVITAMEKAGIYEDALLIVLADHGISFEAGLEHWRRILPETVGDVAAVPMFIKAPGREGGLIDDRRALTIDLLPTIAEVLG